MKQQRLVGSAFELLADGAVVGSLRNLQEAIRAKATEIKLAAAGFDVQGSASAAIALSMG